MELTYELTKQDYINFNIDNLKISDVNRKRLFYQKYVTSLLYLVFPFILSEVTEIGLWYWLVTFGIVCIVNLLTFNWRMKKRVVKYINKTLKEANNKDLLGIRNMNIAENGIAQTTDFSTHHTKWEAIEKVIECEEYIYLYNSAVSAYIIPLRVFHNPSEKQEFLNYVRRYTNK